MSSNFNTHTRREDISTRLKAQNMRNTKEQTKKLETESRKMEERLKDLKHAMSREKEERESQGVGFWKSGQTGKITTGYIEEVMKKPAKSAKESKAPKKIQILKDIPIELPKRNSGPGTMAHIAKQKVSPKENKHKGPKCGQCEDRAAALTCVQCAEDYCAGCFAGFHLKGALKRHRSVPLHSAGPRQYVSPRPNPPLSVRSQNAYQSSAEGSVSLLQQPAAPQHYVKSQNSPQGASGSLDGATLLTGKFNEDNSAASFQQALNAWRSGNASGDSPRSPRRPVLEQPKLASVETSTSTNSGTVNTQAPVDIKFSSHSISYADKLLLKQHRRTDLEEMTTPRLNAEIQNELNDEELNRSVDRVVFSALYEAIKPESSGRLTRTSETSSVSIIELTDLPLSRRGPDVEEVWTYRVQEKGKESVIEYANRSPSSTKSVKMSRGKAHLLKSGPRSDDMILRTANSPTSTSIRKSGRKSTESLSRSSIPKDNPSISHQEMSLHDTEPNIHSEYDAKSDASCKQARRKSARSASSRAKKQPSSARTKSRQTTRTQSRAKSRSDSRLKGDGHITSAPSDALKQIASLARDDNYHYINAHQHTNTLTGFFMVGVQPKQEERTLTPTKHKNKKEQIKVSNKLYHMAPRSWRPDSSLGVTVPLSEVQPVPSEELIMSWSYSNQISGQPISVHSSPIVQGRDGGSRTPTNRVLRSSKSKDSIGNFTPRPPSDSVGNITPRPPSDSVGNITPRPPSDSIGNFTPRPPNRPKSSITNIEESGRTSQAIVMDGEDLSLYDDTDLPVDDGDEETLDQLEWELASQTGRLTAEGAVTRMSAIELDVGSSDEDDIDVVGRFSRLSQQDGGYDIHSRLREDELLNDFEDMEQQMIDEEDVKGLL